MSDDCPECTGDGRALVTCSVCAPRKPCQAAHACERCSGTGIAADEADTPEPRTKTISDGDECGLCDKPLSEALVFLEDGLLDLLNSAVGHGLPAEGITNAVIHAALETWGAESVAAWILRQMEENAPQMKELIEPLLLTAMRASRGGRSDA